MKKNKITLAFFLFACVLASSQTSNSVSLGSGYVNQSFYSLENGETGNINNENWDLAFSIEAMSYSIRINDGKGVELYNYTAGDTWNVEVNGQFVESGAIKSAQAYRA